MTNAQVTSLFDTNEQLSWTYFDKNEDLNLGKPITALSCSLDDKYIAVACADVIRIINPQSGQQVGPSLGHNSVFTLIKYSSGSYLVTASIDKTIRIWDSQLGIRVGDPLVGHTEAITCVCFAKDGQFVVSGSFDFTIRIWNVKFRTQCSIYRFRSWVAHVTNYRDLLILSINDHYTIYFQNIITGNRKQVKQSRSAFGNSRVEVSPNGNLIAVKYSFSQTLQIYNIQSGKLVCHLRNLLYGNLITFSRDGHFLVFRCSQQSPIIIHNLITRERELFTDYNPINNSLEVSSDGKYLIGAYEKCIRVQPRRGK